jgi:hypothetical protein
MRAGGRLEFFAGRQYSAEPHRQGRLDLENRTARSIRGIRTRHHRKYKPDSGRIVGCPKVMVFFRSTRQAGPPPHHSPLTRSLAAVPRSTPYWLLPIPCLPHAAFHMSAFHASHFPFKISPVSALCHPAPTPLPRLLCQAPCPAPNHRKPLKILFKNCPPTLPIIFPFRRILIACSSFTTLVHESHTGARTAPPPSAGSRFGGPNDERSDLPIPSGKKVGLTSLPSTNQLQNPHRFFAIFVDFLSAKPPQFAPKSHLISLPATWPPSLASILLFSVSCQYPSPGDRHGGTMLH